MSVEHGVESNEETLRRQKALGTMNEEMVKNVERRVVEKWIQFLEACEDSARNNSNSKEPTNSFWAKEYYSTVFEVCGESQRNTPTGRESMPAASSQESTATGHSSAPLDGGGIGMGELLSGEGFSTTSVTREVVEF